MKRRIKTFQDFVLEQSSGDGILKTISKFVDRSKHETERQAKTRIAKSLVQSLFGDTGELATNDNQIKITEEVKERRPYKGCGANEPYPLERTPIPVGGLKYILSYLNKEGIANYERTLKDLEDGKAVIIGLRNRISIKKQDINQDRFIDGLYFIPANAPLDHMVAPYQITTVPSLAYYGEKPLNPEGTGIKLPGETLYYLREADIGHGRYKMLIEGEAIDVGRYPEGTVKFETYRPPKISRDQNCGMHIHRSSDKRGICVGPWSAGCQVFADGSEYDEFIEKLEKSTKNGGEFFYALVELDSIDENVLRDALDKKRVKDLLSSIKKEKNKGDDKKEETASFEEKDYEDFADRLYDAFHGSGTDEDTVFNILRSMKNREDWRRLKKAFGKRGDMTLIGWLKDDLEEDEIKKVNSIIKKFGERI